MRGQCHPFGPLEGAFMAASGDEHGSMIEVYPTGDARNPDERGAGRVRQNTAPRAWPFHVLLSVPLSREEVERIGAREGWRAKMFGRGMQGQSRFSMSSSSGSKTG